LGEEGKRQEYLRISTKILRDSLSCIILKCENVNFLFGNFFAKEAYMNYIECYWKDISAF
jgi:hypothetical protein